MKKFLAVADFEGFKQWLLIILLIFSFSLIKIFNLVASYSVNGILLSLLLVVFFGVLYWLIFEIIAGLFYSALKITLADNIKQSQFMNILRTIVLFSNLIIFFAMNVFIYINFFTIYLILFFNVIISFLMLLWFYKIISNHFLIKNVQSDNIQKHKTVENLNEIKLKNEANENLKNETNENLKNETNKNFEMNENNKNDFKKIYFNLTFVYLVLVVVLWGIF